MRALALWLYLVASGKGTTGSKLAGPGSLALADVACQHITGTQCQSHPWRQRRVVRRHGCDAFRI